MLVRTRQDVTVSAQVVSLQFNTSTRELTIDRKMLMDLPVKARNPFTLALLDPAVVNRYTSERKSVFHVVLVADGRRREYVE